LERRASRMAHERRHTGEFWDLRKHWPMCLESQTRLKIGGTKGHKALHENSRVFFPWEDTQNRRPSQLRKWRQQHRGGQQHNIFQRGRTFCRAPKRFENPPGEKLLQTQQPSLRRSWSPQLLHNTGGASTQQRGHIFRSKQPRAGNNTLATNRGGAAAF